MTDYYVEPEYGDDANDGTSMGAGNSWATIQNAADTVSAGDTVYLVSASGTNNDESPTVEIDFDGAVGTAANPIKFIGVNASGVDDGERYKIDGGSLGTGLSLFVFTEANKFYYFKNIELNNAKNNSCELMSAGYIIFDNVVMDGATNGAVNDYGKPILYYRCRFSNSSYGVYRPWMSTFMFCSFIDNSAWGCTQYHGGVPFIGCIFHGNTSGGLNFEFVASPAVVNCVFDGNGTGLNFTGAGSMTTPLIGCRITNNTTGLGDSTTVGWNFEDFNFFLNNTTNKTGNNLEGGNSLTSGTEGYADRSNDNFALTDSATLRRTAVEIP